MGHLPSLSMSYRDRSRSLLCGMSIIALERDFGVVCGGESAAMTDAKGLQGEILPDWLLS